MLGKLPVSGDEGKRQEQTFAFGALLLWILWQPAVRSQSANVLIFKYAEEASGMRVEGVTADRWDDIAQVMGTNGASAGCWRMFWRRTNQEI
jgi:hypothetical protein